MISLKPAYSVLLDLLDIGLVAYVIYRIALLLRGTMALRVFVACASLFAVNIFSRFMGLSTVNWILDNLLASLFVMLVVIFQHDIRRMLVTPRRKSPGGDQHQEEAFELIDEIISAADSLAGRKIGALLIFEREMPLGSFMAVGTEIDAKVTSELLTSIFLPYSPIHDGAVIIQRGKLTKAGCFLPLTQDPEIDKNLGTRHRAAIGLTEVVDAVAVVVSEESGKVSVVVRGKITRDLDDVTLRKVLRRLLEPRWMK